MYQKRTQYFISSRMGLTAEDSPIINRERFYYTQETEESPYSQGEAKEIAAAVESYRLVHRRCFLSFEELVGLLHSIGWQNPLSNCYSNPKSVSSP